MANVILGVLMILIFGRLLIFGIKAAWTITKFALYIVLAPIVLILFAFFGMTYLAIVLLVIIGIISLVKTIF